MDRARKIILLAALTVLLVVVVGWVRRGDARAGFRGETAAVERGNLQVQVSASGVVQARQTAVLVWKADGSVAEQVVEAGTQVDRGEILAEIETTSLAPEMILAQVELIEARRALEDLLNSQTQQAQALNAVDTAEQQLEAARHPENLQASAAQALADAQKAWESANRQLAIIEKPASQQAIDQAYSNLLLSENRLNQVKDQAAKIQRQLDKPSSKLMPWESKGDYRKLLRNLEIQLSQQQLAYDQRLAAYNRLLAPPDPVDLAAAQAAETLARAELEQAQREAERVQDGLSPAEISLLEAELADARREYERVKDGPTAEDLQAAQARLTAAQATLEMVRITAPFNGVITQVYSQPGDQVMPGQQAFRIDDLSALRVEVFVSEVDILKVRPGQKVEVTLDGVSPGIVQARTGQAGSAFQGRVIQVLGVGRLEGGVTTYPVTIEMETGAEWMHPGMTAAAAFTTQEVQDAVLVPNAALRFEGGERVVFVLRGGEPVPIPVELGATDGTFSQLLAGDIQPGDQVVTRFPED